MKAKKIVAGVAAVSLCLPLAACNFKISNDTPDETTTLAETTTYVTDETTNAETTLPDATEATTFEVVSDPTTQVAVTTPAVTQPATTQPAATQPAVTQPDYSSYTKAQVLETFAAALNKTRAYTGAITVHHKETFDGRIVEATPGGALANQLGNYLIGAIADPSEEDFNFNGGQTVNADGETIPILLPQRTGYSLPEAGVASASVTESNGSLNVHIQLVPESVGLGEVPTYNSGAIGYLDTSKFTFKIIKVNSCTISYPGSTIDAVIRPDGYIGSCIYTINMSTTGNVTGFGITGGGTIEGAQTEVWTFKW